MVVPRKVLTGMEHAFALLGNVPGVARTKVAVIERIACEGIGHMQDIAPRCSGNRSEVGVAGCTLVGDALCHAVDDRLGAPD